MRMPIPYRIKSPSRGGRVCSVGTWIAGVGRWFIGLVLLPVLLLGGAEWGLRAVGFGHSSQPFLERRFGGRQVFVRNKAFFEQFISWAIPPEAWELSEFEVVPGKAAKTYRVFLFGESTPEGWPDPTFSFSRLLAAMLEAQYPGVRFEVYNAAFRAVNSHAMRAQAKVCGQFEPDLFVVYLGNNEVHGPFSLVSTLEPTINLPSVASIRVHMWANNLRLTQLLWGVNRSIFTRQDDRPSPPVVRADDPRLPEVYERFENNLEDVCKYGTTNGAKVVLCTIGVNLRHWRPTESMHLRDLGSEELEGWNRAFARGTALLEEGLPREAAAMFEEAAHIDDTYADLHFQWGQACWKAAEYECARRHFVRAHGLDSFSWVRAKPPINDIIKSTAERLAPNGVYLVDVAHELAEKSEHQCPGIDLFDDYCHFNMNGCCVVAAAIFRQVTQVLPAWISAETSPEPIPLDCDECMRRVGISPVMRLGYLNHLVKVDRFHEGEAQAELERQLREIEEQAQTGGADQELDVYRQAVDAGGTDYLLLFRYAQALLQHGKFEEAVAQAQILVDAFPYRRASHRTLAIALARNGEQAKAVTEFEKSASFYPDDLLTYDEWSKTLRDLGQTDASIALLRKASVLDRIPESALCRQGSVLALEGRYAQAEEAYREAIRRNPYFPDAYVKLDELYKQQADVRAQLAGWQKVAVENPGFPNPHRYLGMAYEAVQDFPKAIESYKKAYELDPSDSISRQRIEELSQEGNARTAPSAQTEAQ